MQWTLYFYIAAVQTLAYMLIWLLIVYLVHFDYVAVAVITSHHIPKENSPKTHRTQESHISRINLDRLNFSFHLHDFLQYFYLQFTSSTMLSYRFFFSVGSIFQTFLSCVCVFFQKNRKIFLQLKRSNFSHIELDLVVFFFQRRLNGDVHFVSKIVWRIMF